jgi:hypothetical protein
MRTILLFGFTLIAIGCGKEVSQTAAAPSGEPAMPPGPVILNRDFANWSRFPIGTIVKIKSVTLKGDLHVTSIDTLKLLEKSDTELVVERQNTTERNDGSLGAVNPPERRSYRKSFALPHGMSEADFDKPSLIAKSVGKETVEILGKKYEADVYTWADQTEAGPLDIKLWWSDEMPGRLLKQTMKLVKGDKTTNHSVIELTIPEAVK